MNKTFIIILVLLTMFSCEQKSSSTPDQTKAEIPEFSNTISQKQKTDSISKYLHTRYEYADPTGKKVIIENSFPKGGLTYTDPLGRDYVYTIFWTRIINETDSAITFSIDFPSDPIKLPSSQNNAVRIYLPTDPMKRDKKSLFNYGLDLEAYLNKNLHPLTSLQRTIAAKESNTFYVVTLFDKGVNGTVRTGLHIEGQALHYTLNDLKLHCGQINLPDLELQ